MNNLRQLREGLRYREGASYSREAVAGRIGVAAKTLARWEAGERAPDVVEALALARELRVSVEQLGFARILED